MKRNNLFIIFLIALMFSSCYKEEKLTPSELNLFNKFTFDENDPCADDIKYVMDNFGLLMVYKGFTLRDINFITGTKSKDYQGYELTVPQAKYMTSFFRNYVFDGYQISNEIIKNVVRPYFYLINDLTAVEFTRLSTLWCSIGKDFWMTNASGVLGTNPSFINWIYCETPEELFTKKIYYLGQILLMAETKATIAYPNWCKDKQDGGVFDMNTNVKYSIQDLNAGNKDHFLLRGFPGHLTAGGTRMTQITSKNNGFKNSIQLFKNFIALCMLFTPEEMENGTATIKLSSEEVPYNRFPDIMENYYKTIEFCKEQYGWDLTKVSVKYTSVPTLPTVDEMNAMGKKIEEEKLRNQKK